MNITRLNLLCGWLMVVPLFSAPSLGSEEPRYPVNPAIADTAIYISHNGLSRFDLNTLSPIWRSLSGVATLEPVVTSQGILVGSPSGLYVIDSASGTIRWKIDATTTLFSPTVHKKIAYVGGEDGSLRAIDLSNKQTLWHKQFAGWIYPPAISGNHLVVGGGANEVRGVDSRNGRVLWTRKLAQELVYRPVISHDRQVVITTFDGEIALLDLRNGSTLWRVRDDVPSFSPLVMDDLLVFGTFDGRVRAIDSNTGNTRWEYELGGRINLMPKATDDLLVVVNGQGDVVGLNAATGKLLWRRIQNSEPISSPLLRDRTVVLFTSKNGVPLVTQVDIEEIRL